MPRSLSLIETRDVHLLERVDRLRLMAWSAVGGETWSEGDAFSDDPGSWTHHWVVREGDEPIAAARLTITEWTPGSPIAPGSPFAGRVAVMSGLIVAPSRQGLGLAARLDEARQQRARDMGCRWLIVHANRDGPRAWRLMAMGCRAHNPRPRACSGLDEWLSPNVLFSLDLSPDNEIGAPSMTTGQIQ